MFIRQSSQVEVNSPAKLNLFLEVLARRTDGYHEIETLMVAVTIYDSLFLTSNSEGSLELTCEWAPGLRNQDLHFRSSGSAWKRKPADVASGTESVFGDLPASASNIVIRALECLRVRAGISTGARVVLRKRIPSAAGLGGASSDAAAALVAANQAWRLNWSRDRLAEVAAELGSDIPFFLGTGMFGSAAAICRGRGEQIETLPRWPAMHFVVVRPPVGLSTPQVYRHCRPAERPAEIGTLLAAAERGDVISVATSLRNRLQPAAELVSPWIERVRREFQRLDFLGHQMSGSGSSYFGICRHARHARRMVGLLRSAGIGTVFGCQTAPSWSQRK